MREGYELRKLGDICNFYLGLTYTPKYVDEGVPFLSVKDITKGYLSFEKTKYISYKEFEQSTSNAKPQKGDVIFGRVGTLGRPLIVNTDREFCIFVSLGFIRVSKLLSNRYLQQWMSSRDFIQQVNSKVIGSAQKNLNVGWLRNFTIPLPPLKEQEKIADILSTADDKIEAIASQIEKAETLKKGLLQKLLSEGIGHTEFKDSELGRIPVGWEITTIGKATQNFDGQRVPLKSEDRQAIQGNYPYYGAQGIIDYINDYIFDGKYLLVAEDGENVKGQKYDIAFVVNGKFWVNNHAHILQANEDMNLYFISSILNHINIIKYVTGTGQPKLNKAQLNSIKIPLPPLKEQKQIANILSTADKKLEILRAKKEKYETLKQGLMQKLLTGEVRVQV